MLRLLKTRWYERAVTAEKLVVADRDGTLIRDHGRSVTQHDISFIAGTIDYLRSVDEDTGVAIATNQRAVATGIVAASDLDVFHLTLVERLSLLGVYVSFVLACTHHAAEDGAPLCPCRKPNPGMIIKAMSLAGTEPGRTLVIGDQPSDMQAAGRAGVKGIRTQDLEAHEPIQDVDGYLR